MIKRIACALLLLVVSAATAARAAERVDLALVLAVDVSRSVDAEKFELQRQGYAAAISDRRVIEAIRSGREHRIALMYMEWSGLFSQKVVVGWTLIDGPQAAKAFVDKVLEAPRAFANRTSISSAIDFAVAQLSRLPYFAERQTIDVSGDGTNNAGGGVTAARDAAVAAGITVNGLVILSEHPLPWNPEHTNPPGGLAAYYRANVVGGPGAFVMQATNFGSFGDAILKKMIAEIAANPPPARPGPG